MTTDDLHREIKELRNIVEAQTDFIGILISNSSRAIADIKALSELLGEVLEKHGINKSETAKRYEALCAKFLIAEQQTSVEAAQSADKSRPPSASGPEAERN